MRAEIIAIGTELLMGEIINRNAAWISKKLAEIGIDVYHHVVVGDNLERIQCTIREALRRVEVVIITGGLGATPDDLTIEALSEEFESPLIYNESRAEHVAAYFAKRGKSPALSDKKIAYKPSPAVNIFNPIGYAMGLFWDVSRHCNKLGLIMSFPGVPRELEAMWDEGKMRLLEYHSVSKVLKTQDLHFFGISESLLSEKLSDLMILENPTVAPYVGHSEVRIRIAAKAANDEEAMAKIATIRHHILERVGEYYFAENEDTLEGKIAVLLKKGLFTLSVAESCTGGLVSSRLTDISGSSDYIQANIITYSNDAKIKFLGVKEETLKKYGAVSRETAREMAEGVRVMSGASIGVSLTGIAGPLGGTSEKPVGLLYVGLCGVDGISMVQEYRAPLWSRKDIKYWFSQCGLHFLYRYVGSLFV